MKIAVRISMVLGFIALIYVHVAWSSCWPFDLKASPFFFNIFPILVFALANWLLVIAFAIHCYKSPYIPRSSKVLWLILLAVGQCLGGYIWTFGYYLAMYEGLGLPKTARQAMAQGIISVPVASFPQKEVALRSVLEALPVRWFLRFMIPFFYVTELFFMIERDGLFLIFREHSVAAGVAGASCSVAGFFILFFFPIHCLQRAFEKKSNKVIWFILLLSGSCWLFIPNLVYYLFVYEDINKTGAAHKAGEE